MERQYYDIPQGESLKTRLLYFDLKRIWNNKILFCADCSAVPILTTYDFGYTEH
jgi:hypothetical protein